MTPGHMLALEEETTKAVGDIFGSYAKLSKAVEEARKVIGERRAT